MIIPVTYTPQYLGDLEDNSPLPFSIPLATGSGGNSTSFAAGNYPVSLRVTYSDELRNTHEVILNNTVSYNPPPQQEEAPNQGFLGFGSTTADESTTSSSLPLLPIILAAIAAAVAFVIIMVRRRRSRRKKISRLMSSQNESDEDDFDESLDENLGPSQNNEPSRKE
jgi:hypothetical protein